MIKTVGVAAAVFALAPVVTLKAVAEDYKAKAMAFLTKDAGETKPKITLTLVDLNGDGIPEGLATVTSPIDCGSHGCTAYVLDLTGPRARSIGDFIAFDRDLKALPTKTHGWRDVSLNDIKQVYRNGKYVSTRR